MSRRPLVGTPGAVPAHGASPEQGGDRASPDVEQLAFAAGRIAADAMVTRPKMCDGDVRLGQVRGLLEDDHVHMALLVGRDMCLLATLERSDLPPERAGDDSPARSFGRLEGRVVRPFDPLDEVAENLLREHRRRAAVVDEHGRLVGLLCLKQSGRGFCSDEGIAQREAERSAVGVPVARGPAADGR